MSRPAAERERVTVIVPVKDGERYLAEVLAAVAREGPGEILVTDSGSRDSSVAIARAAGARVLEIAPEEFGHGRTRNEAAEAASGDVLCFLTQDATPIEGWLDAHLDAFALADGVGAAFGPHLPRPDTSPMIARELIAFFRGFAPDGAPTVERSGGEPFLSNVNASYRRECWERIRFRDVRYAEDQAFGRDMLEAGYAKAFHPGAGVLHAHDYGAAEFMRRYFDEYRGLRETTGHVEPLAPRRALGDVRGLVAADRRWMTERGYSGAERVTWTGRSLVHHTGRRMFAALGSRAERLPPGVQRAVSLEGRASGSGRSEGGVPEAVAAEVPPPSGVPVTTPIPRAHRAERVDQITRVLVHGGEPLLDPVPGMGERQSLHVAIVVPPFRRGAGGHNTIFQTVSRLEGMGHTCSVWIDDPFGQQEGRAAVARKLMVDHFAPVEGPLFKGFDAWYGADVVMATGWQTVYPTMMLPGCRARAYMVNDHEPEFYGTSVESYWAEQTYRLGLHCIAASPWLRDLLIERYGASATEFQLGVDHGTYRPRPVERRRDTVVFYARQFTSRRAVGLGLLALHELHRRRPELRVVLYGDPRPLETTFTHEHLGIVSPEELSWVYSEATVGICLSMTNFSLIPKEMLACGLPCVELSGVSAESIFGEDGALELAPPDPVALADAVERLLDDPGRWRRRSEEGMAFVASHTWDVCAAQTEAGLREALRRREHEALAAPTAVPTGA